MHPAGPAGPAAGSAFTTTPRPSTDPGANSSPSLQRSTSTAPHRSTSNAVRPSPPKHFRSPTSFGGLPNMISPEEYAALPASIQKKYFSPKERLCIVQQSAILGRKKQKTGLWITPAPIPASTAHPARPSSLGGLHSLESEARPHDPKLFVVRFGQDSFSAEEARWFLSLPEKIKSKRFSRDELVSLTAKAHLALGKPLTDGVQRRRSVHRLEASACTPIVAQPAFSSSTTDYTNVPQPPIKVPKTTETGQPKDEASKPSRIPPDVAVKTSRIRHPVHDTLPAESDNAPKRTVDPAAMEMEILKLYLRRPSIRPKAPGLTTKRSAPILSSTVSSKPTEGKPRRRFHMLTPLPLPPPVLAPPEPQTKSSSSASARLPRPFLDKDSLTLDHHVPGLRPSAQTSPKEREGGIDKPSQAVLEVEGEAFGPAVKEQPTQVDLTKDGPYPHLGSAFSADDSDDDNFETESISTIGPRTPSPMESGDSAVQHLDVVEFRLDERPKTASMLVRTSDSSLGNYKPGEDSLKAQMSRLRQSTESEVRVHPGQVTSGVDVATLDPLALEALPVSDDQTGAHGAFAKPETDVLTHSKGLKRVLKSLKRL